MCVYVHTRTCRVCTPWPTDNRPLGTSNNALYFPSGASPHLTATCRSKPNRLRTCCMLGEHLPLHSPFNKAPDYGQLLSEFRVTLSGAYVHACTTPFAAGMSTRNEHEANLPTFTICRASCFDIYVMLPWNALCILHYICATCVCVWRVHATLRHGVTKVHSSLNSSFYQ